MRGCGIPIALVAWGALATGCARLGYDPARELDDAGAGTPDAAVDDHDGGATADAAMSASCATEPSPADLVVHLRFDEADGTVASDASGRGNHGQLVGMDEATWVPGHLGNALDFDGVDDRVNAGSATSLDDLTTLTMCAWVFPRAYPSSFPTIADKSTDSFVGGWFFYVQDNGTVGFQSNKRKWVIGGAITLDTWQHVCASWDGSDGFAGIRLYQGGLPIAASDTGSNGNATDSDAARELVVGRVNDGSFPFDGMIDDYRLYRRVLGDGEIAGLYACAAP